jgi:hypothetical protein
VLKSDDGRDDTCQVPPRVICTACVVAFLKKSCKDSLHQAHLGYNYISERREGVWSCKKMSRINVLSRFCFSASIRVALVVEIEPGHIRRSPRGMLLWLSRGACRWL